MISCYLFSSLYELSSVLIWRMTHCWNKWEQPVITKPTCGPCWSINLDVASSLSRILLKYFSDFDVINLYRLFEQEFLSGNYLGKKTSKRVRKSAPAKKFVSEETWEISLLTENALYYVQDFQFQAILTKTIDYRCDNRRFWLSAHNCQVPTPTSQNLELDQQIWIFEAD
jgi:hypothetical protein